jgi:hypothetical protein
MMQLEPLQIFYGTIPVLLVLIVTEIDKHNMMKHITLLLEGISGSLDRILHET